MQNLPSTKDLAQKYNLIAKKSLGQNFLFDHKITDKIASGSGKIEGKNILEIGPGPAGLTKSILAQNPKKLIVIEQDFRVIPLLQEVKTYYPNNFEIIHGDALKISVNKIFGNEKFKIIANLPYNIGTVLVFKWLETIENIESMTLLLQKEVVERIVAKPNSKQYGRLSVMINSFCDSKRLFDIAAGSFVPAPKVTSSLIQIIPKKIPQNIDFNILSKVCAAAFNQRRKMLRSSLKSLTIDTETLLKNSNINPNLRAEQLSLEDFARLAYTISHLK